MICSNCGTRLKVTDTRYVGLDVIRLYRCPKCGQRYKSLERITSISNNKHRTEDPMRVLLNGEDCIENKNKYAMIKYFLFEDIRLNIGDKDPANFDLTIFIDHEQPKIKFINRVYLYSNEYLLEEIMEIINEYYTKRLHRANNNSSLEEPMEAIDEPYTKKLHRNNNSNKR